MAAAETILISVTVFNELLLRAIKYYDEKHTIPTYEDLEANNLLTDVRIQRLLDV